MKKLGVCIHGAGWVASEHIDAFQAHPQAEVVALSHHNLEGAKRKAEEKGLKGVGLFDRYDKMLESSEIDIVAICTPNHLHAGETIKAAQAGKHIMIEKPVATKLADLRAMHEAVKRAGVKTVVSFVLRWNPLFEIIKSMLAEDAVGEVYYVETDYIHIIGPWYPNFHWARTREKAGSSFLMGGCHAVDAMRWFASKDPAKAANIVEVKAYQGGYRKGSELEYEGFQVMMVKFDNGALGKVSSNFDAPCPYTFPIEIFGDKGVIRDNRVYSKKYEGQTDWISIPTILPDSGEVSHHPFEGQDHHLIDCILSDRESHCNLEDSVNTHEAIFACEIAANEDRTLRLPLNS